MIPSSVPMVHCPGRWDILARQLLTWGSRPGTPTPMGFLLPDVGPEPAGQALINLGLGGYAARALRSACRRGRTAEHVLGPHRSPEHVRCRRKLKCKRSGWIRYPKWSWAARISPHRTYEYRCFAEAPARGSGGRVRGARSVGCG